MPAAVVVHVSPRSLLAGGSTENAVAAPALGSSRTCNFTTKAHPRIVAGAALRFMPSARAAKASSGEEASQHQSKARTVSSQHMTTRWRGANRFLPADAVKKAMLRSRYRHCDRRFTLQEACRLTASGQRKLAPEKAPSACSATVSHAFLRLWNGDPVQCNSVLVLRFGTRTLVTRGQSKFESNSFVPNLRDLHELRERQPQYISKSGGTR